MRECGPTGDTSRRKRISEGPKQPVVKQPKVMVGERYEGDETETNKVRGKKRGAKAEEQCALSELEGEGIEPRALVSELSHAAPTY